jgi:alanyl-tRNA synthetase
VERLRREAKRKPEPGDAPKGPDVEVRRTDGVVVATVEAVKGGALRDLSDRLRQQEKALAVLLGSSADDRAFLVVNLDRSLPERGVDAAAVVREVAPIIGGGGGGRPTLAEAGGKDPQKLGDALERAERLILTALE